MAIVPQDQSTVLPLNEADQSLPSFRSPPHNFEAEKALLGAIFANNNAYDRVSDFLRPEHFADPVHGRIFEASLKLIERGQIADPITLRNFFEQDGALADVGGAKYVAELAASMVSVINAVEYGRNIYDLHLKRQLIDLGEQVVNNAYSPEIDDNAMSQIEVAEQRLYDLATKGDYEGGFKPFKTSIVSAIEMAEAAHKRDGLLSGVGTGLWQRCTLFDPATHRLKIRFRKSAPRRHHRRIPTDHLPQQTRLDISWANRWAARSARE